MADLLHNYYIIKQKIELYRSMSSDEIRLNSIAFSVFLDNLKAILFAFLKRMSCREMDP